MELAKGWKGCKKNKNKIKDNPLVICVWRSTESTFYFGLASDFSNRLIMVYITVRTLCVCQCENTHKQALVSSLP